MYYNVGYFCYTYPILLEVVILTNHLYLQSETTEIGIDFLKYLESDTGVSILSLIEDPADLIRISAVSRFWRQFGKLKFFLVSLVNLCVQPS